MNAHRSTVTDTDWEVKSAESLADNVLIEFRNGVRMIVPNDNLGSGLLNLIRSEVVNSPWGTKETYGPEGGFALSVGLANRILKYVTTGRTT